MGKSTKRIITVACLLLMSSSALLAQIILLGKKDMIEQSELIVLVDIQELISTDRTKSYADLMATGYVSRVLKGYANREITFRIPRFFPCAAFDVSTGRHLVFLKKNEKDEYIGVNWYMSYIHLAGETTKWFGEKNSLAEVYTSEQVIEDTERELRKLSNHESTRILQDVERAGE